MIEACNCPEEWQCQSKGKWDNTNSYYEHRFVCEWYDHDALPDFENGNRIESLGGNFLPKDFGHINNTSDRDYDHDTIPDVDEIDFDAIRKISGDAIGRITVKEYNSFYGYASCPKTWRLSMSDTALRQLAL